MIKTRVCVEPKKKLNQCRTMCNGCVFYSTDGMRNKFYTIVHETKFKC